ncbi:MAG: undecaprenyl-diphosphate phosphatase [Lachnospiraceae bacterium]|nr:undecaprenyl-diphosphate phosphatase [Lachnospiraceae bacterium]
MIKLIFQILIYGIIEGITEWLPISSTGHLILFESFWPMELSDEFLTVFRVVIQLGAILAVIIHFFRRLNPFSGSKARRNRALNNWIRIIIGCIPAGIAGLLLDDFFDKHFFNWQTVTVTLFVYGVAFILVETLGKNREVRYRTMEDMPNSAALLIGLAQILSLVPGTSRSGVTILAALLLGCSRAAAMDFTFCMAIPIMIGSSGVKLIKHGLGFSAKEIFILLLGMAVAFVVSYIAVRYILRYVRRNSFKPFGWYRIALAALVLIFALVFPGVLPGSAAPASKYGLPEYVTEDYITVNQYSRPGIPLLKVNDIVIHYTGNPGTSAEANRNYFNSLSMQTGTDGVTYGSSNFIVGLDGEILAVVPIDEIAYCSNNRNEDTISIETCHPDEDGKFNETTYGSLVRLTAWLCDRYGLTSENVIRHYDVTGKLCPLYYVVHEDEWETFKADVQRSLDQMGDTGLPEAVQ